MAEVKRGTWGILYAADGEYIAMVAHVQIGGEANLMVIDKSGATFPQVNVPVVDNPVTSDNFIMFVPDK